ncbi:Imm50 family immunity protein [Caulobacter sp. SSI4214]|uniref:Imm50 family immunity protein n=1 Tax=Caulobacter sp. SSI4214 TaxID=2575739 RepID=UPI00143974C6|nr:Imm50 family immunity protein [Caulobacter sp. SSI4214]
MTPELLRNVPGGPELVAWFGYAPRFHDAEVLSVILDRDEPRCSLRIHGFEMTSEVDAQGFFVCTKHTIVTFHLIDLLNIELSGFNGQNAVMDLSISRGLDAGFRMVIDDAWGLAGTIEARQLEIELQPGIPAGSQYAKPGAITGQGRASVAPAPKD